MKLSSKIQKCGLSPMRKFYPCEVAAEARGLRVHHLNIGQPDIETPKAFFDAARSFGESVLAYAPAPGVEGSLEAVRDYYGQLGYPLTCDEILATYGGSEALQIVLSCILDEGDEILIPEPYYPNYDTFVRSTGGVIRPIPTTVEEGYRYADRAKIEPLINAHTRAILITNPGNPTGVVLSAAERRLMVDIAREHDLFLISDEVYREIVYGAEAPSSMLEFADAAENVAVVDSVSKRFSATGARVGALISRNKELMGQAMKLCQGRLSVSTLDMIGATALYAETPKSYLDEVNEEYKHRRDVTYDALQKMDGVVCAKPEGAFYISVKLPVDDSEKFIIWMLENFDYNGETLMMAPLASFYSQPGHGVDEVRIAYVLNAEDMEKSMAVLAEALKAYPGRK